ncbi:MAG: class I SAM-dependent methyltransferase [Nannocystaceae bacterium]
MLYRRALPRLSARLACVAKYVIRGRAMADVGTDHAQLPVALVLGDLVPFAIASDRAAAPLLAAAETVRRAGVGGRVRLRQGDGLEVFAPGEVQTVVMAGMGGRTMVRILERGFLGGVTRLVLQPQGGLVGLRRWCSQQGWWFVDEELVGEGGRHYVVEVVERPGAAGTVAGRLLPCVDALDRLVGPRLREKRGRRYAEYLAQERQRVVHALAAARSGGAASQRVTQLLALDGQWRAAQREIDRRRDARSVTRGR